MTHTLRGACLALVLCVTACRSNQSSPTSSAKPQAAKATVTHVVFVWLKTPGDEAARKRITDVSQTFKTIPGVVSVTSGRALPSTRPVVDSSYDVAIVMTFTDEAALRAYDQ